MREGCESENGARNDSFLCEFGGRGWVPRRWSVGRWSRGAGSAKPGGVGWVGYRGWCETGTHPGAGHCDLGHNHGLRYWRGTRFHACIKANGRAREALGGEGRLRGKIERRARRLGQRPGCMHGLMQDAAAHARERAIALAWHGPPN